MQSLKRTTLEWFDLLILSLVLFGQAIVTSTLQFIDAIKNPVIPYNQLSSSALQNYQAIALQLSWLFLAFLYLYFRKFDFSVWTRQIKWSRWVPLQAIGIFVLSAICVDIFHLLTYQLTNPAIPSVSSLLAELDVPLVLYALLNGFYEELFFLGVCLTVKPAYTKWAFLFSLIVRFSFHTYQGLGVAVAIGFLMGGLFYFLYQKMSVKNLLPFFLAHSIADILGLSILFYFSS